MAAALGPLLVGGCDDAGLIDGRFTAGEWERARALSPLPPPRKNPTNAVADDARAAALGQVLFHDAQLSAEGTVSCASCHVPTQFFADARRVGTARARGRRNTPSVVFAAYSRWQMWDGAADSPWAQPLLAIENPAEHGLSRLGLAHKIAERHREAYEMIFGALPPLADGARFPAAGRPGDAAWQAMAPEDRFAVERVAANVGKAIEAFERTLFRRYGNTLLDAYLAGDREAMSPAARDGLRSFVRRGCVSCHDGPLLTDQDFHALRMPDDEAGGPDAGRFEGLAVALGSALRADGAHSDAPDAWRLNAVDANDQGQRGQFRTPSLRGVGLTAPYGHAGALATLRDVVLHDAGGGLPPADPAAQGQADSALFPFVPEPGEVDALVAFLEALTPVAW